MKNILEDIAGDKMKMILEKNYAEEWNTSFLYSSSILNDVCFLLTRNGRIEV